MSDPSAFAVELGRALTGEALPLRSPLTDDIVAELGHLGFGVDRLVQIRRARQEAGEPWPFPVQAEVVREVGFAVFQARLQALRKELSLTGLQPRQRVERALDAEERRLSADRPPHWG